jgi:hypothetical protein
MPTAEARYRSLVPICIAKWHVRHIYVPERTTLIQAGGVDKGGETGIS